jgi:hypothetical protein
MGIKNIAKKIKVLKRSKSSSPKKEEPAPEVLAVPALPEEIVEVPVASPQTPDVPIDPFSAQAQALEEERRRLLYS